MEYLDFSSVITIIRKYIKDERTVVDRNLNEDLATGSFSPLMRDFIFDVKVPRPCRHFCGRDTARVPTGFR